MIYKSRLHPLVSAAEIELFKALSVAGLTTGMVTQDRIILKSTVPDFYWPLKKKVVYVDGFQVHSKDKALQRDEEINNLLEIQGYDVLRLPYTPPLTKDRKAEMLAAIQKFLGANDK